MVNRKKLGVRKFEEFRFANQKTNATYWFTHAGINKCWKGNVTQSEVSLNWLLNDKCKVIKVMKRK